MLSALLSISWDPEIRGFIVVLCMVVTLIGGSYLLLGSNLGARLGFHVLATAIAGWMMCMGVIWAVYGIGLTGPFPAWNPSEPITIVRDGSLLDRAEVVEAPINLAGLQPTDAAKKVSETLVAQGWSIVGESDSSRGQAIAAADELLQNGAEEFAAGEYVAVNVYNRGGERYPKIGEALDFIAFKHKPRYAIVEVAPVIEQRVEPGRAPARVQIDNTQSHRYVVMIRDLGARRVPAFLIAVGSGIIFFLLAWMLHRRETLLRKNLALKA
jgi:hypothetical protein